MNKSFWHKIVILWTSIDVALMLWTCTDSPADENLKFALSSAGQNRHTLESVLSEYETESEKYAAARFVIENMPGHCSYMGNEIHNYYDCALSLMKSDLSPKTQRDSLLTLTKGQYSLLEQKIIQDVKIVTSDFLIFNIEEAYNNWKNGRWARILNFDQFCEWLLPYKCVELQELDHWRDTLADKFSDDLMAMKYNDESYYSPFKAVELVRNEIIRKIKPVGLFTESGYPMLSAETISKMTFGRCSDYVNLAVLTYRSLGIPAVIDETPIWGRYRTGHSWYVIMDDKGRELPSEWDISSIPGSTFFPYQRIPKVYRNTYAINYERVEYQKESKLKHPFSIFQKDVSEKYFRTADVNIPVNKLERIVEPYLYIACFSGHGSDWKIVDYGKYKNGIATFRNMGRDILYLILGYDGKELIPVSSPFVLNIDGSIDEIKFSGIRDKLLIRRKYLETENVVTMKNRILGGVIQASNNFDFSSPINVLTIDSINFCDKIPINTNTGYRYWRYLAPNGSYGSIAELAFFDEDTVMLCGTPISNIGRNTVEANKAFDDNWLTNFETNQPDENWVGSEFDHEVTIRYVRVVPRGDDNNIHPGDEYELSYWDGNLWIRIEKRVATDNYMIFEDVPQGTLLWLKNHTRGWDERPFVFTEKGIEWW